MGRNARAAATTTQVASRGSEGLGVSSAQTDQVSTATKAALSPTISGPAPASDTANRISWPLVADMAERTTQRPPPLSRD
jgi:hypothetical protein